MTAVDERWNRTATPYPRDRTLDHLFADQVRSRPGAPAATFGETSLTYLELDRAANVLAARMRRVGIGPEVRVALYLDRDVAVVVAMVAVMKAGGAYVPLDPSHPPLRLRQIVDDARPLAVLARRGTALDTLELDLPVVDVGDALTAQSIRDPTHDAAPSARTHPDSLLYVMYTSGSTGQPKGVCVTHRNVVRLVCGTNYFELAPGERMAQISNAAFDASTLEVWGALVNGGHLVGFDRATVLTPSRLARALRTSAVHTVVSATALFHQVVDWDPGTFASTARLLIGGEQMDPRRARAVVALGGPILTNGYGPTESTTFATTYRVTSVPDDTVRVPIGGPIANTQVHVLDDLLRGQPVGEPGQLHVAGDGLARCYLGRPDLTAERFLPDPFGRPGTRMYATGDVVRWLPDGVLDFVGRADFQVKVRGYRVELAEIDAVLLRQMGVAEAVTVALGETSEERRLICYYAGPPGKAPEAADLASAVRAHLPDYMVPVQFIKLNELPKNPNRKIDRGRLPAPEPYPPGRDGDGATPEGEITSLLAELLQRADVRPEENFFEIGGHSLLAIRVINRLAEQYGVDMPLEELFDQPTAREIAAYVRAHLPTSPAAS